MSAFAETPGASAWIPCSQRLPKPNAREGKVRKYYLVQNEFGDMMVASFSGTSDGRTWWEQIYAHSPVKDEIVAWMPLPKGYSADPAGAES